MSKMLKATLALLATAHGLKMRVMSSGKALEMLTDRGFEDKATGVVTEELRAQMSIAEKGLADIITSHPNAKPEDLAAAMRAKLAADGILTKMNEAARAVAKVAKNSTGGDLIDSGIVGMSISVSGEGSGVFGPTATLVAFANVKEGETARFCFGIRGGVNFPKPVNTALPTASLYVGGYSWADVDKAAVYLGPSLGSLSAHIATKASSPLDFIGIVFPIKAPRGEIPVIGQIQSGLKTAKEMHRSMAGGAGAFLKKASEKLSIDTEGLGGDAMLGLNWCPQVM